MVEAQLGMFSRNPTPVAISLGSRRTTTTNDKRDGEPTPEPRHSWQTNSYSYDTGVLISPTFQELRENRGGDTAISPDSMQGDGRNRSTPVRDRSRTTNRSRQPSTPTVTQPPTTRPATSLSPPGYFPSFPASSRDETSPSTSGFQFQGSHLHYGSSTPPFNPTGGFFGQYPVPTQSLALSMGPTPHYRYPHGLHPTPVQEAATTMSQNMSAYQSTMQPHPPHFHYQPHRSNDGSNTSGPFPISSPAAPPHVTSVNQAPIGLGSQTSPISPPYMPSNYFSAMGYPPPLPSPHYAYQRQFANPPALYQGYGAVQYAQHPTSPPDVNMQSQGGWYYLPRNAPPPQPQQHHHGGAHYPTGYLIQYPSLAQYQDSTSSGGSRSFPPSVPPPSAGPQTSVPDGRVLPDGSVQSPVVSNHSEPPSNAGTNSPSNSAPPSAAGRRPVARREWHPRPPPHRSPWVMWVGNVPSDASQKELWDFFTRLPVGQSMGSAAGNAGVESIFLIVRSNCAFINYASETFLAVAIKEFNGLRLRPNDPQCPMLVCKIRHSSDDLKSGVGGQRGMGLHKQWLKDQHSVHSQASTSNTSNPSLLDDLPTGIDGTPEGLASALSSVSLDDSGARPRRGPRSSGSDSYASTTSSFLAEYFPTRYFILKSLSEYDLDLSVQSGFWATQQHNEVVLDQAFRTATDVYLIFSVNKSGEFYGYARMIGPIRQGEGSVPWASRSDLSSPPGSPHSTLSPGKAAADSGALYFTPESGHLADSSPLPIGGADPKARTEELQTASADHVQQHYQSAPAKLGGSDEPIERIPSIQFSFDQYERRREGQGPHFELDPTAPLRAVRGHHAAPSGASNDQSSWADNDEHLQPVQEAAQGESEDPNDDDLPKAKQIWGACFKIEWLERRKVPFHRTRHLRNAWNRGREIKISRDGTELEPGVGRSLLEEWDQLLEP